jgi:DNA polymerase-3 subunit delta
LKDVDRFFEQLDGEELPPVIAVGGVERALVDDVVSSVRKRALEGAIVEFNHDRVSGKDGAEKVTQLARTLPAMARRRLVELDDADGLPDADKLEAYLDDPSPETVLLIVFGKWDARSGLGKAIKKRKKLLQAKFDHPRERDMPSLARARARRYELKLGGEIAEALALTVGTDLVLLDRALEKLALVADSGKPTLADITEQVTDTHIEDAFRLTNALAAGDRGGALASLRALEAARDEPLRVLGLCSWQLRRSLRARAILDEGGGTDELKAAFNLYPRRAQELASSARKFTARQHERRLSRAVACDRSLKGSRASGWRLLERMVFELCPPPRRRA